jgi:hypothetical protein
MRQAAALSLKCDSRHAAAVGDSAGHDGGSAWCAAWLAVEGEERHSFIGHPVEVWGCDATAFAAAVDAEVAPAYVVTDEEDDVWLGAVTILCVKPWGGESKRNCEGHRHDDVLNESTSFHDASLD